MADMFLDALKAMPQLPVRGPKNPNAGGCPPHIVKAMNDAAQRPDNKAAIDAIVADMVARHIVAYDDRKQQYVRGPAALWGE